MKHAFCSVIAAVFFATVSLAARAASPFGTLVYENTYDTPSEITSKPIPVVASGIGTANTSGTLYDMGYGVSYTLETPAGMSSPMVKVSGQGQYVPACYVNGCINVPGTYTMTVDYYIPQESGNVTMDYGFGSLKVGSNGKEFKEVYAVQGKLSTFTLTYELTEGKSFSGIYIARAYTGGSYYIDNFRLYYKAPHQPLPADPTLGELIVSEDFETASEGTVIFNSSSYGGTLPSYANSYVATPNLSGTFAGKQFCFTRGGSLNTSYVAGYAGNMAIRVDQPNNGSSTTPHIGLNGGNSNQIADFNIDAAGTYTIKADFIIPAACTSKIKQVFYQIFVGDDTVTYSYPLDTSKTGDQTYTLQKSVTLDGGKPLRFIRFIAEAVSADANAYFFVDNVQLYHMGRPASVVVGGNTVKQVYYAPGSTVSLPYAYELYESVDAYQEITGFRVRETGETYPCGSTIVTTQAQTSLTFDAVIQPVTFTAVCDLGNAPGLIPEWHFADGDTLTLPDSPNGFALKGWCVPWQQALLAPGTTVVFNAETMGKYAVHGRRLVLTAVWDEDTSYTKLALPSLTASSDTILLADAAVFAASVYEAYYGKTIGVPVLCGYAGIESTEGNATWADIASLLCVCVPQNELRPLTLKIKNENAPLERLMRAGVLSKDTVSDASVSVSDLTQVLARIIGRSLRTLADEDKNTVFVVGDSLCAGTGIGTYTGWVRKLDNYLDGNLNIVNIAVGGYNTTSYYKENPDRYFNTVKQIEYGDYVFLALGTNDATLWTRGDMTMNESRDAFYRMSREVMLEGGTPLMICPVGRNLTDGNGNYIESDPDIITCMNAVNTTYAAAIPIVNFKSLSLIRLAGMSEKEREEIYYDKWIHYSDYGADYVCGLFEELLGISENTNLFMLRDHFTFTHISEKMPAVAPGVNAMTGSVSPWTFEDAFASIPVTVSDASIVNNPHSDSVNHSSSVMRFSLDTWKAWVYAFAEPVENDRPMYVSFDYFKTADDPNAVLANLYICKNGLNDIAANLSTFTLSPSWRHYAGFPTFDGAYSASDSSVKNTDPLMSVGFQHGGTAGSGHTFAYYDNISIIPAYKITYMANDGTDTEITHEYVLFEGDKFATFASPDLTLTPSSSRFGYTFLGFSLDKDATSADAPAKIALNHRDIILYGVWEKDADSPDAVSLVYDFETEETCGFNGVTYTDGMANVTTALTITGIAADARAMRYAVIRLKGEATQLTLSFTTSEEDTYTAAKSFTSSVSCGDGFDTVVIATDKTANEGWTGIIEDVRIEVNAKAQIEDVSFLTDYSYAPYDGEKAALYASCNQITADGGSVTLSPFYRASDGSILRTASYETDSLCAVLEKQPDGSAILFGRNDGTVTVKAHFADSDRTASVTIYVTNQSERVPSASFKVICFGNSIRAHAPNASLGWSGSWGMAASSEDKDYAHRFIFYLDEKFGQNAATLYEGYWMAGIEGIWKQYENDPTHDFTDDMAKHMAVVEAIKPDIITVQCGENAGVKNAAAYENALTQFVRGLQKASPNAKIVLCTPFWGGDEMIEGVYATAKTTGASVARLDTLDTAENRATGLYENGGVANHPGDTGMDNIAKLLFEQVNVLLTEENAVAFTARPSSVSIIADQTVIDTDGGTLTLSAAVSPADAAQSVVWSVDDENVAVIDQNGVLRALRNGQVTVTAASKQDGLVSGTVTVTVLNQTEPFTLTFVSDLPDAVLPSAVKVKGMTDLSAFAASCDLYRFLGWSSEEGGAIVRFADVCADMTLYARFEKAFRFDFERDGYDEGFTVENGFNRYISDGVYLMLATDTTEDAKLTVHSPTLALDPRDFDTLRVCMSLSAFDESAVVRLTIHTASGDVVKTRPVTTTDMTDYIFSLDGISDTVVGFTLEPTDTDCSVRLDLIAFERVDGSTLYCRNGTVYAKFSDVGASGMAVVALYDGEGRPVRIFIREAKAGDPVVVFDECGDAVASASCMVFASDTTLKPLCRMTVSE